MQTTVSGADSTTQQRASDRTSSAMTLLPQNFRSATIPRQPNGSLGMVVREREDGGCYVDGFADDAAELTARGSVIPGDHILAVAGRFIDGKGQRHLRELLKEAPDPVVLLLRREPNQNGPAEASNGRGAAGDLPPLAAGSMHGDRRKEDDDAGSCASVDSYGSCGETTSLTAKRSKAVDQDILMSIKAAAAAAAPPSPAAGSNGNGAVTTGMSSPTPPPVQALHGGSGTSGASYLASGTVVSSSGYQPYEYQPPYGAEGHPMASAPPGAHHQRPHNSGPPPLHPPMLGQANDPYAAYPPPHPSYLQGPRPHRRYPPPHGHGGYPPSYHHPPRSGGHHPGGPPPAYRQGPGAHQQVVQQSPSAGPSQNMSGGVPPGKQAPAFNMIPRPQMAGHVPQAVLPESGSMPPHHLRQVPIKARQGADDRRFGLGPLNAVLERARSDVDALFRAYEANTFTRWQLKMALKERTPTLDGNPPRLLKQGGGASIRSTNTDGKSAACSNDGRSLSNPRARGSPEEKQRMLMLMLAHDITPLEISENILKRDKSVHLCRDKLVASQGYWVAISQERMRHLFEANNERRVYVYFEKDEVSPLPRKFSESGFIRTRATMNIDRKSNGTTLRAQVQRVQFSFKSPSHPDEPPLIVEYDLYHTKPYLDLLGIEQRQASLVTDQPQDGTTSNNMESTSKTTARLRKRKAVDEHENGENEAASTLEQCDEDAAENEDEDGVDSAEDALDGGSQAKSSHRRIKRTRLTNGTRHPGGQLAILDSLATQAASAPRVTVPENKEEVHEENS